MVSNDSLFCIVVISLLSVVLYHVKMIDSTDAFSTCILCHEIAWDKKLGAKEIVNVSYDTTGDCCIKNYLTESV